MREIKPGDKIKVISAEGEIPSYLEIVGKTYIVEDIKGSCEGEYVKLKDSLFMPYLSNCELVDESKENEMTLDDLETGMRLITRDGSQFIVLKDVNSPCYKNVNMFIGIDGETYEEDRDYTQDLLCEDDTELDIVKIYAQNKGDFICGNVLTCPVEEMDLIWERKENRPILTDKEKKYLAEVIRPFRDKIKLIKKTDVVYIGSHNGTERLLIALEWNNDNFKQADTMWLPIFKGGEMFVGMETNKPYSLEELGLDYE